MKIRSKIKAITFPLFFWLVLSFLFCSIKSSLSKLQRTTPHITDTVQRFFGNNYLPVPNSFSSSQFLPIHFSSTFLFLSPTDYSSVQWSSIRHTDSEMNSKLSRNAKKMLHCKGFKQQVFNYKLLNETTVPFDSL